MIEAKLSIDIKLKHALRTKTNNLNDTSDIRFDGLMFYFFIIS